MRKHLLAGTALAVSAIVLGSPEARSQQPNNDPVITSFMQNKGLSEAEARRRVEYSEKARELQARLEKEEPTRFAGLYVDEGPQTRVVARLGSRIRRAPAIPASAISCRSSVSPPSVFRW